MGRITINGWAPTEQQKAAADFVQQVLSRFKEQNQEATQRVVQMKKADKRANRSTKVPMRPNNTARLQDALYNIGAYSGQKDGRGNDPSYEKAVDGLHGRMTDAAIQKARDMGYEVDTEKGTVTRRPLEGNKKTENWPYQDPYNPSINFSQSGPGDSNLGNGYSTVGPTYRRGNFGPVSQYAKDLVHYNTTKEGSPDIMVTNKDFSDLYNQDVSRLAQVAYRQYVRQNGYPKPGQTINLPINPSVYKEINSDGKYANFTMKNLLRAALGGTNQVEFTDGGMSGKARINPQTGLLEITFTDRTAWDDAPGGDRIGDRVRQFMEKHGSKGDDKKGDFVQQLQYTIPADTISGDFRGRLRSIPSYYNNR